MAIVFRKRFSKVGNWILIDYLCGYRYVDLDCLVAGFIMRLKIMSGVDWQMFWLRSFIDDLTDENADGRWIKVLRYMRGRAGGLCPGSGSEGSVGRILRLLSLDCVSSQRPVIRDRHPGQCPPVTWDTRKYSSAFLRSCDSFYSLPSICQNSASLARTVHQEPL